MIVSNEVFMIPKYIVTPHPDLINISENSESALQTLWQPGYGDNIFVYGPLLTWTIQVYNLFSVRRGAQNYKHLTSNWGDDWG